MPEHNLNDQVISEWREGWAGTLAPDALVDVFERALDALWRRAHISLGQLTLMAIVDRVLHQGAEKYPHLSALKIETSGVRFGELRQKAPNLEVKFLEESLVFLMLELLRVLGVLTGEILTPGLHAELRKVQVQSADEEGEKT